MSDPLQRLARWGSALEFAAIPVEVVAAAKTQILSALAAVHAGYRSDLGAPILKAFGSPAGTGSHAIPSGTATSPSHAAFLMASWGVVLDFDDIMLGGHVSHSTTLVPFAYAEAANASGPELLCAQIVANEITARVNMTVALGTARGQMAANVHLIGAAAARSRIEHLGAEQFAQSLGFALSSPPKPLYPGFLGSDAKVVSASWPTRMGLEAVDAVKGGLRGNTAILDQKRGFIDTFAKVPVPEFLDGLGERWHTATNSIKQYPACGYLNAALDATLALVRENAIDTDAVGSVEVRGSIFMLGMDAHSAPYLRGRDSLISTLTFSTPYVIACALVDRALSPDHLTRAKIQDMRIWDLAKKVRVVHDMDHTIAAVMADIPIGAAIKRARNAGALRFLFSMGGTPLIGKLLLSDPIGFLKLVRALTKVAGKEQARDFSQSTKALGATVKIRMQDGRNFERTVSIPEGFAGSGDWQSLRTLAREKYITQATLQIGHAPATEAAALIEKLETLTPSEIKRLVHLNCIHRGQAYTL